jgi:hypothetical protein
MAEECMTEQLRVGDTVRVKPYQTQNMSGHWSEAYLSNRTGVIISLHADYSWRREPTHARIRMPEGDGDGTWNSDAALAQLELVSKGNGTFELGVTHPFSPKELRLQRWADFQARANAADLSHQGYSNRATFLAWMYLNQEPKVHAELPHLWRQDGTINPNKLHGLFARYQMEIDEGAYMCPLETPVDLVGYGNPIRAKLGINWDEVAAEFTRSKILEVTA